MGFMSAVPLPQVPAKTAQQPVAATTTWSPIANVLAQRAPRTRIETSIHAVHDQIALIAASHAGEDMLVKLCAPIGGELHAAAEAAKQVNADDAATLMTALDSLQQDLTRLDQMLGLPTKLKWHTEFAAVFDGEAALRRALRAPLLGRGTYTGEVDPQKAFEAVQKLADNAKTGTPEPDAGARPRDPFAAVTLIESRLLNAYEFQALAVRDFDKAIHEDWPASTSLGDILAELVTDALIAVVTDGVGLVIERGLKKTAFRAAQAAAESAGKELHDPRLDLAKSGLKDLFVGAAKAGVKMARGTVATNAKDAFVEALERSLLSSKQTAHEGMIANTPALAQLDFEVLCHFADSLVTMKDTVHSQMFHAAHLQWQNLKAYNARAWPSEWAQHPKDPNLNAPKAGPYGDRPIAGVLEVGMAVNPEPTFAYLVLRDAEPEAIKHFRDMRAPIASLGLNRQYMFSFDGAATAYAEAWTMPAGLRPSSYVKLGVGAKEGFQRGTLSPAELLTLKLYRAGYKPGALEHARAELFGLVDKISDADALETARGLVDGANHVTTAALERG